MNKRFGDDDIQLTILSAVLYGVALCIEIALARRITNNVPFWRTVVGCGLMTYLCYFCARNVVWGRLFLYFNVLFSTALVIIALMHWGVI